MDTLSRLNEIFIAELNDGEIKLNHQTTANDVEGWDSLSHVTLVLEVERHFAIRFDTTEIANLSNVGDFVSLIEAKLSNR